MSESGALNHALPHPATPHPATPGHTPLLPRRASLDFVHRSDSLTVYDRYQTTLPRAAADEKFTDVGELAGGVRSGAAPTHPARLLSAIIASNSIQASSPSHLVHLDTTRSFPPHLAVGYFLAERTEVRSSSYWVLGSNPDVLVGDFPSFQQRNARGREGRPHTLES